jgi:hypothetical protein
MLAALLAALLVGMMAEDAHPVTGFFLPGYGWIVTSQDAANIDANLTILPARDDGSGRWGRDYTRPCELHEDADPVNVLAPRSKYWESHQLRAYWEFVGGAKATLASCEAEFSQTVDAAVDFLGNLLRVHNSAPEIQVANGSTILGYDVYIRIVDHPRALGWCMAAAAKEMYRGDPPHVIEVIVPNDICRQMKNFGLDGAQRFDSRPNMGFMVILHEFLHGVGFARALIPHWPGLNGSVEGLELFNVSVDGVVKPVLSTEPLRRVAGEVLGREIFSGNMVVRRDEAEAALVGKVAGNIRGAKCDLAALRAALTQAPSKGEANVLVRCDIPAGAVLDADLNHFDAGSHPGEVMNAELGADCRPMIWTGGVLESTGWYDVDFAWLERPQSPNWLGNGGEYPYGNNQRDFNPSRMCLPGEKGWRTSFDYRSGGYCYQVECENESSHWRCNSTVRRYYDPKGTGFVSNVTSGLRLPHSSTFACNRRDDTATSSPATFTKNSFAYQSRRRSQDFFCFDTKCVKGKLTLLAADNSTARCNSAGEEVRIGGVVIKCNSPRDICAILGSSKVGWLESLRDAVPETVSFNLKLKWVVLGCVLLVLLVVVSVVLVVVVIHMKRELAKAKTKAA